MNSGSKQNRSEFEEIISAFNSQNVEYAIVGGYAVVYYGHVRNTQDLDIFVRSTTENAKRIVSALKYVGFNNHEITEEAFTHDNGVRLGVVPTQIDVIAYLPGVDQNEVWARREIGKFGSETAYFISRQDLIDNKKFVARPQDIADTQNLAATQTKTPEPKKDKSRGFER
jgi:hypothetical protein